MAEVFPETPEKKVKPGWKTTEFWLAIGIPPLVAALNQIFGLGLDVNQIASLFGFTLPGYALSRGLAK